MTFWRGLWDCKIVDLPKYLRQRWRTARLLWVIALGALVFVDVLATAWWETAVACAAFALSVAGLCIDRRNRTLSARLRAAEIRRKWAEQVEHARFN